MSDDEEVFKTKLDRKMSENIREAAGIKGRIGWQKKRAFINLSWFRMVSRCANISEHRNILGRRRGLFTDLSYVSLGHRRATRQNQKASFL